MVRIKKEIIKRLVNGRIRRVSNIYNKKIESRILSRDTSISYEIIKIHRQKWSNIYKGKINSKWLLWYIQCNGIISPDYVPENVFYTIIEPILNNKEYSKSYSDKNFYELFYPQIVFPKVILRCIDNSMLDKDYKSLKIADDNILFDILRVNDKVIIKPSIDTFGGKNVQIFISKGNCFENSVGEVLTLRYLKDLYKGNFIIQKVINQHPFLSRFNQTSVNNIRVFTYRSPYTNDVKIQQVILKVGRQGQIVDNSRSGGYSIGIDFQGRLNQFAMIKDGTKYDTVHGISLLDNGFEIPFFNAIKETAILIAERNIHHRLLGLDLTIDNLNNIICIEINNYGNDINFYQYNNGPLFGDFTDEVIEFCKEHKDKLYRYYSI